MDQFRETPMFGKVEPGLKSVWLWIRGKWQLVAKGTREDCLKRISELRKEHSDVDAANLQIRPWQN